MYQNRPVHWLERLILGSSSQRLTGLLTALAVVGGVSAKVHACGEEPATLEDSSVNSGVLENEFNENDGVVTARSRWLESSRVFLNDRNHYPCLAQAQCLE